MVDPYAKVRAECRKKCPKEEEQYNACVKRISDSGQGDCEAWYLDIVQCADKCIAPRVFKLSKGG